MNQSTKADQREGWWPGHTAGGSSLAAAGAAPELWKSCNRMKDPPSSAEVLGQILPGQTLCSSHWIKLDVGGGVKEENVDNWTERVETAGDAAGAVRLGAQLGMMLLAGTEVGVGVFS